MIHGRKPYLDTVRDLLLENEPRTMIEIGSTRRMDAMDDGNSTPWFAHVARDISAQFYSVDVDRKSTDVCRDVLKSYGLDQNATLVTDDGVRFLQKWDQGSIGFLYLDAWDYDAGMDAESESKHLEAFKAASKYMGDGALVLFDDIHDPVTFKGKGALAIPWGIAHGFDIVFSASMVLLRNGK